MDETTVPERGRGRRRVRDTPAAIRADALAHVAELEQGPISAMRVMAMLRSQAEMIARLTALIDARQERPGFAERETKGDDD